MKPPEVLTRDRLLGTYEVKPTLARLKTTLLGTGGSLLFSAFLLFGLISTQADADGMYGMVLWGSLCTAEQELTSSSTEQYSRA